MKYKVITEFSYLEKSKKLIPLKVGTIIKNFEVVIDGRTINIDKGIVSKNPEYFQEVDWEMELLDFYKKKDNKPKAMTPKSLLASLKPFIEEQFIEDDTYRLSEQDLETLLDWSRLFYFYDYDVNSTTPEQKSIMSFFKKFGYTFDNKGISKI